MAPTTTTAMTSPKEHLTLTHKIRKPLVEKLRRERINSSIEQLKSLLGSKFLKQEPDSKMEKADILEMTVEFVRQQQLYLHGNTSSSAANQGHFRCFKAVAHFLSKDEAMSKSERRLVDHLQNFQSSEQDMSGIVQASPVEPALKPQKTGFSSSPWRPW